MTSVIRSVEDATPDKLTALLEAAGLSQGQSVTSVDVRRNDAFNSTVAHLELHYHENGASLPAKLVLKLNREGQGQEEVAFYQLLEPEDTDTAMLVPCVSAAFDLESGASHLLLLDVSGTHEAPVERHRLLSLEGVPTEARLRGVTEALARFHAVWWEHPLLDKSAATRLTERYRDMPAFEAWWTGHRHDYEQFAAAYTQAPPNDVHSIYRGALEHYPKLWERYLEPRRRTLSGLTLTHNDCYLTQFLCPKSGRAPTYLVDFQSACTNFAARDLVYLMATFWTREQRQRHERDVLRHYHQVLLEQGVTGYDLDQLFEDYRLMLIDMVFHPVWDTTYGADPGYWQPKMRCLTDAYRDWQCNELFS